MVISEKFKNAVMNKRHQCDRLRLIVAYMVYHAGMSGRTFMKICWHEGHAVQIAWSAELIMQTNACPNIKGIKMPDNRILFINSCHDLERKKELIETVARRLGLGHQAKELARLMERGHDMALLHELWK